MKFAHFSHVWKKPGRTPAMLCRFFTIKTAQAMEWQLKCHSP
jgi:hypothetical protein